jgi:regulator of protease activity HflC (stomatin/prohibitin superfamily)
MLMTAHDPGLQRPEYAPPPHLVAADSLFRPLAWLAIFTSTAAAALFALSRPVAARWFPALRLPGLGPTMASLILAAFGLVACLLMVAARRRGVTHATGPASQMAQPRTARLAQTLITLAFSAAAAAAVMSDWPMRQPPTEPARGFATASILLLLATPWLLAQRYIVAVPAERLPESVAVSRLVFLPVVCLGAQAVLEIAAFLGFGALGWVHTALSIALLLIGAELSLRALAKWFLPPPDSIAARAPVDSFLAVVLAGRPLSPASVAGTVRSQFGMDFSRSWALHFMRATAAPVALVMLASCWFLTGVTRIELNQRGAYERFGSVGTILKPGLHLVLPWPLGIVRPVEFGVIHSALISYEPQGVAPEAADNATAEGEAPASANRLWDSEQPTDVSYIIASSENGRQSFQTVSASVRVLYRIGLTDADARAALYREGDPGALVSALTGRMLAQFFAARTLPSVLGENQDVIAADVGVRLRQALDALGSGIDIVAVTIETIHPPAGAATAYRNVQAVEIEATASIATERGRAQTTRSLAQRDAHGATNDATAAAAQSVSAAKVDLTDIAADDRPYLAASRPFLLERYFADVQSALADVPLEIVDHRLTGASLPTIDLRSPGAVRDAPTQAEKQQ